MSGAIMESPTGYKAISLFQSTASIYIKDRFQDLQHYIKAVTERGSALRKKCLMSLMLLLSLNNSGIYVRDQFLTQNNYHKLCRSISSL